MGASRGLHYDGSVVLVPVKAFGQAKERLGPILDPEHRASLAKAMAEHVLLAARPLPVAVVCDDPDVARWADDHGADVLLEPGKGLNGAVSSGVSAIGEAGGNEVIVTHADLPLADSLQRLAGFDGVTLVPDRREDGTNVICLPTATRFGFSYGPGSFARHRLEAARVGLEVRILREPALAWDVDVPSDIPDALVKLT